MEQYVIILEPLYNMYNIKNCKPYFVRGVLIL